MDSLEARKDAAMNGYVASDELAQRLRQMKSQGMDVKAILANSVYDCDLTIVQGLEIAAILGGELL